jgi:hypothetical protein
MTSSPGILWAIGVNIFLMKLSLIFKIRADLILKLIVLICTLAFIPALKLPQLLFQYLLYILLSCIHRLEVFQNHTILSSLPYFQ